MTKEEIESKQPKWCSYDEAARPIWGCWSLLSGLVTSEEYCKKCEMYKNK